MASCGNVEQRSEGDESADGKGKSQATQIGKPVIWAGMFITNKLNPGNMITIQLDDQDDIIELALMIQQLIHECGCCNCEEE